MMPGEKVVLPFRVRVKEALPAGSEAGEREFR
jgi:hypothetical protein